MDSLWIVCIPNYSQALAKGLKDFQTFPGPFEY